MTQRVLIIDDSALSLAVLLAALKGAGFEVVAANNLADVSQALASGPFHAVVIDLEMPETFGDDLSEFLREAKGLTAPVILYSDFDDQKLRERAAAVKASGCVNKSSGVPALISTVKQLALKAEEPKPTAPRGTTRVMIVDDSEMTAKLIEAELEDKGFEIILADSVDKATRLILKKQTRPNLILLDVNMPNVDGAHFCRFIKGNSLFKGIKVVLCSGMEVDKLKGIAAACGADGFVPKDSFLSRWVLEQIEPPDQAR
ncbi:MAG TPA: two-component system response regulator [Myxococcales bacterium]|jgi:CheY-like chemotaxis protein|nr:two-component system response regulator [Myxococcales bacterium]